MPLSSALYPGTFDCLTYGHLNLIERCARCYKRVVVAVARNSSKVPIFTVAERLDMLRHATRGWENVEVDQFDGLTVHYAREHNLRFIIRGLRAVSDFESELQLALMNQRIAPDVETVFMAPTIGYVFVSSSLTKEILSNRGDVSSLVPPHVEKELKRKILGEKSQ
ncbi:MAG: pantetheine-phosphate adenylyltransferase [Candidatus Sumerlaeota bacterium]